MITHDRIDAYFRGIAPLAGATVFSEPGFSALAGWSERQRWWPDFARSCSLCPGWRSSAMGDSHLFALSLFAFLHERQEMAPGACQDDNELCS